MMMSFWQRRLGPSQACPHVQCIHPKTRISRQGQGAVFPAFPTEDSHKPGSRNMPEQGAAGLEQDLAALLLRRQQDSQKRRRTNRDLNVFCNF